MIALHHYGQVFLQLVQTPFLHVELVWGIVPLYFAWILNELTSAKASFQTALQIGFSLLWAGAHWAWQYFPARSHPSREIILNALFAVNILITLFVLALGALAMYCGLRRKFPAYCSFLGHSRFGSYFMISIFPIQAGYLKWSWDRFAAILLFAGPIWVALHFALARFRK